ncbi:MAG TPA: glycosyltransferase family 2 protein [Cyanobacteria bacterium UBA9971]|nr:glycosyltransferase family 2 protein [Cyanobacteria bacterium UBA9971]
MTISVVIHTYNSEKYLEKCLESVKSVEEIVICDMHSTDRTIEIAQKYGAKIVYHENLGFADPARNFALSHATQEWILVLDSDEMVTPELLDYLREYQTNHQTNYKVVYIPRKNILLGKVLWSWYPNPIMRFFKNGVVTFDEKVHCTPTVHGVVGEFFIDPKRTDLALIHYNYDSIEAFISRMNKYTSLELEKFKERNIKFSAKLLFTRPIGEFFKRYLLKKGYKDGWHGFIFAVLMGIYKFVAIIKLWQSELNLENEV